MFGNSKGADIRANSGAPGSGIPNKFTGCDIDIWRSAAIFIADGVYIDNSSVSLSNNIVGEAAGGGNPSTDQDDASNRITDIDPEDIANIEILKGASVALLMVQELLEVL